MVGQQLTKNSKISFMMQLSYAGEEEGKKRSAANRGHDPKHGIKPIVILVSGKVPAVLRNTADEIIPPFSPMEHHKMQEIKEEFVGASVAQLIKPS